MNKTIGGFILMMAVLSACASLAPIPPTATPTQRPPTFTPLSLASKTPEPSAAQSSADTLSSTTDCSIIFASYDLPHDATDIGGKELYDLAATEPRDTYLSASATVTEAQHLVSASDGVDGTLILGYIGDLDGDVISTYGLLIYLPDGGEAVSQLPVDSKIAVSGPYVGYVYPPENLFVSFPNNEAPKTKFPSIKAETAAYGCD